MTRNIVIVVVVVVVVVAAVVDAEVAVHSGELPYNTTLPTFDVSSVLLIYLLLQCRSSCMI